MRTLATILVIALASCAIEPALAPAHPARADATTGRLAGAPATLRPGVAGYDLPALRTTQPPEHHHHAP